MSGVKKLILKLLQHDAPFTLENGTVLPNLEIAYHTFGKLNEEKDNVIWVCHALTANSDAEDWWHGLVGKGHLINPENHFIVCVNMLGSCYGSTGPTTLNPETGEVYGPQFPQVTIRDMVRSLQLVQQALEITKIKLCLGGSMGGQQVLEWAIIDPDLFEHICLLATNAQHSPWGIAFNEAQRMAIEADLVTNPGPDAGKKGLEAARAIAMLSYRHYQTYWRSQLEATNEKLDDYRASSYQRYQGQKLENRFDVYAYLCLSKAMDSHNVGRGRKSIKDALERIKAPTLVIGIETDILFPIVEQQLLAEHIPNAHLEIISSNFGHDGFLIEFEAIEKSIRAFFSGQVKQNNHKISGQHQKIRKYYGLDTIAFPGTEGF